MEEDEDEPEAEVEAAGPSDSCLTQDEESSCDTSGPQPNGHHHHAPSTEEESSSEPLVVAPAEPPDDNEAREEPTPKEGGDHSQWGRVWEHGEGYWAVLHCWQFSPQGRRA